MIKIKLESMTNSAIMNDGKQCNKGDWNVFYNPNDEVSINGITATIDEVECDGVVFEDIEDLKTWIDVNLFKNGGGSGEGAVDSVTGNLVDITDPANPIVGIAGGSDKKIVGFDAENKPVAMMLTIKQLTDIGGFPSFANGLFAATSMNAENETGLLIFIEFSTTTPKAGTFPSYGTGGVLPVGDGVADGDAVNLKQLTDAISGLQSQINNL